MRNTLRWLQYGLFACAFVLLGYCALDALNGWVFQEHAKTVLARETGQAPHRFEPGDLIGRVDVDRLGVSVAIVEGSGDGELKHAAGHIIGTAFPGQRGNVAIAAHRDTFFRPLRNIRARDVIRVTTPQGEFRYRVIATRIVRPDNVEVLKPGRSEDLTLVTCYPFYYIGSAPRRFIVRARRIPESVAAVRLQPKRPLPHL